MSYGRRLLAALPPMTRLDSEAEALAWLGELARPAPAPPAGSGASPV